MKLQILLILFSVAVVSCGHSSPDGSAAEQSIQTPVTVTGISTDPIAEYVELTATATYLEKNYVKANVNGYIQSVSAKLGKYIHRGETLFVLKTKEAQSIGNAVNKLDPSFRFSGISNITASGAGYVTVLSHQAGDYVQDGEQLAVINDAASFAFVLNLPYELRGYINQQKAIQLVLPDSTVLNGSIRSIIPSVDPASQTQQVVIQVNGASDIPENLLARVRIKKIEKLNPISLPKAAVLSDEAQSTYWVMKLLNDSTAVKVPITCGIKTGNNIEITTPTFTSTDRFVLTGNYGLSDTAGIKIITQ